MDFSCVIFLGTALISISTGVSVPATSNSGVKIPVRNVFYTFHANGVAIFDPATKKITKNIDASTELPGTTAKMCTPSSYGAMDNRFGSNCSWTGIVYAPSKYIFAADFSGNRLIVIDIEKQIPVKAIDTDPLPNQVEYVAALDEIWVLCWGNSTLNVIGVKNVTTQISKIKDMSSLVVKHSIRAQGPKSYRGLVHGFFRPALCKDDKNDKFGFVTHYAEPGIHKINLSGKNIDKFINTSAHGCKKTYHINYSCVKKYALVQCLGDKVENDWGETMIVVDVVNDRVVHSNDAMTSKASGYPYMSPDGKYALVLQSDRIIPYYFESAAKDMVRLKDIIIAGGFWPSTVAFVKRKDGYTAYVTAKNDTRIVLINLEKGAAKIGGFIKGVGLAANTTDAALNKFYYINKFSYAKILKAEGRNYSQSEFHYYVYLHFMDHVNRAISVGCHADACYAASPSYFTHKIALMDVKKNRLLSLIGGLYWPQEMVWVGEDPSKKMSSSATCHGSYSVLAFLAILLLTCNASSV